MITGDNPLTARAIADEAGVDDFSPRPRRRTSSR
jgi:high-affinity K+ transport system ATPase subunit B